MLYLLRILYYHIHVLRLMTGRLAAAVFAEDGSVSLFGGHFNAAAQSG
jgi:hypothetical protein